MKLLNPDRPPARVKPREFNWQYRALRERVYIYSELLDEDGQAHRSGVGSLARAEAAIDLSLQYFNDVLVVPNTEPDDDSGGSSDA